MAFKSLSQYQEDKNGEFFVLPNDGDSADVVFLYKSVNDVLVADVHYIMSPGYKGYAHCCGGPNCPGCNYIGPNSKYRGLRLDHKIFIPLYNIQKNKIEFWDRSTFFEQVLQKQVFGPFPNPSETVFKITRRGESGSRDTKYDIQPIARNSSLPYEKILSQFGVTFPDYYSVVCKEMSAAEMSAALSSSNGPSDLEDYGYVPVPRGASTSSDLASPIEVAPPVIDTPAYSMPPEVVPPSLPEYSPEVSEAASIDAPVDAISVNDRIDDSVDSLDDVKF